MAELLDGKATAAKLNELLKEEIDEEVKTSGKRKPSLAIILVGNDKASETYVRNKVRSGEKIGIDTTVFRYDENASASEFEKKMHELNEDRSIDGILLQLPLPKPFKPLERYFLSLISPDKDVDCLSYENIGRLYVDKNAEILPATPKGIMSLLKEYSIDVSGKKVCIIGRSDIVGKPLARLMERENATVTLCHSHTEMLKTFTLNSDIIVTAVGKPKFFGREFFDYGSKKVIVDVGINRVDGKLCGDVDFGSVLDVCSHITPVPGGIGPMTIWGMNSNVVSLWKRHFSK